MKYELSPCPFCGDPVFLEIDNTPISGGNVADYVEPPAIWCSRCDVVHEMPDTIGYSLDDFVAWWNDRPAEATLIAQITEQNVEIESLRAQLDDLSTLALEERDGRIRVEEIAFIYRAQSKRSSDEHGNR